MRSLFTTALALTLLTLPLLAGCSDNAAKGVNKDLDRPRPPDAGKINGKK